MCTYLLLIKKNLIFHLVFHVGKNSTVPENVQGHPGDPYGMNCLVTISFLFPFGD